MWTSLGTIINLPRLLVLKTLTEVKIAMCPTTKLYFSDIFAGKSDKSILSKGDCSRCRWQPHWSTPKCQHPHVPLDPSGLLSPLCYIYDRSAVPEIHVPLMIDRSWSINTPAPSPLGGITKVSVVE